MSQTINMTLVTIGIMMVFGGGLFWIIGGGLDCPASKDVQKCNSFVAITNNGLPVMILGFMILPLAVWVFPHQDNYVSAEPRKEPTESPFKTLPKGFGDKDAV